MKRFKLTAAVVLSLMLIFTMAPATAFADDGDVTVYLTVANKTFTQSLLDDNGANISPKWSGTIVNKMPITVPSGGALADSIESALPGVSFTDSSFGKYITSVYGITGGIGIAASPYGDGSSWMTTMNNVAAPVGLSYYVNEEPDTANSEIRLNSGDNIGIYFTIDSGTFDSPYLFTPFNVSTKKISYNSAQVSWTGYNSPVDMWNNNTPFNSSLYEIYRSTSVNGTYSKIGLVTSFKAANSYTDEKAYPGKTYYYKIKTIKKNNESNFSAIKSIKQILTKPTAKVSKKSKKALKVSWKKVDGATKYQVYRATKKNGSYKKVATVSSKNLSYTNKRLKSGKKYYYKVRALTSVEGKTIYSSFSAKKSNRAK